MILYIYIDKYKYKYINKEQKRHTCDTAEQKKEAQPLGHTWSGATLIINRRRTGQTMHRNTPYAWSCQWMKIAGSCTLGFGGQWMTCDE